MKLSYLQPAEEELALGPVRRHSLFLFLGWATHPFIRCIILRIILRMQPLGYSAIVLYI
jgi:hypothetical protein